MASGVAQPAASHLPCTTPPRQRNRTLAIGVHLREDDRTYASGAVRSDAHRLTRRKGGSNMAYMVTGRCHAPIPPTPLLSVSLSHSRKFVPPARPNPPWLLRLGCHGGCQIGQPSRTADILHVHKGRFDRCNGVGPGPDMGGYLAMSELEAAQAEITRLKADKVAGEAVAFAAELLAAHKIVPAQRDAVVAAYTLAATTDAATFNDGAQTPALDALKAQYRAVSAHIWTQELAISQSAPIFAIPSFPERDTLQRPAMFHRALKQRGGDYELAESGQLLSRINAQALFLDAVDQVEPRVLGSLAGHPFDWYRQHAFPTMLAVDHLTLERAMRTSTQVPEDWGPKLQSLRSLLLDWAISWHLSAPWCIGRALGTLGQWAFLTNGHSTSITARRWHHPDYAVNLAWGLDTLPRLDLALPGWNPLLSPEKEAKAIFLAEAARQWEIHRQQMSYEVEQLGGMLVSKKRTLEHFTWVAYWLVAEKNYRQIMDMTTVENESTISKAVNELAKQLLLPLPNRRGRPRKKVN